MRLITVPEICPVAADCRPSPSGPLVAAVARAFVDEVDFTETFSLSEEEEDEEWSQLGPNVFFRRR